MPAKKGGMAEQLTDFELVLVEWEDSQYVSGWHTEEPCKEPLLCNSVGWLVYDGDKVVTIAAHITDEETPQRSGEMTIPKGAIVRLVVIKE